MKHRFSVLATALVFSISVARGQEAPDPSAFVGKVSDWPAPSSWSPPAQPVSGQQTEGGLGREGSSRLSTSPLPFVSITPCRVADTRGNGFTGAFGPPALVGNGPARTFVIPAGPCPGIPANAGAYSINVAAILPASDGFMTVFPTGAAQPTSSDLNFLGGEVVSNAIVAPAGTGGAISVFVNVSTQMILDINGYYAPAGRGEFNTFLGLNAGNFTMTGDSNTGIGRGALSTNTAGNFNTATGAFALQLNTIGDDNTADGEGALNKNDSGFGNTAAGSLTLANNATGSFNTATGRLALFGNETGDANTALGASALGNTTGANNIGIGLEGGLDLTTGSNNICIGNPGFAGESSTIRIGTAGKQTATFIAGITGTTSPGGVAVFADATGKLGTVTSSRDVKEGIRDIGEENDGLMRLRPVAFRYKPEIDPTGLTQYGLIAEEVADVSPDLVVYDRDGKPETVRYHLVNALLLNEVQKQHRTAETQEKLIEEQKAEIEGLKSRLTKLEVRMLANSSPQAADNR
jgi:Chaperone of endosialidase